MTKQDFEIILEIILTLIGLYLAFIKSYFQEKGKNLATLEDIEEITSKVEGIKTEFIKETEQLKFELQYINQIRFSLKSEELKSLIDIYDKYFLWLNTIMDFTFTIIRDNDTNWLIDENSKLDDAYF